MDRTQKQQPSQRNTIDLLGALVDERLQIRVRARAADEDEERRQSQRKGKGKRKREAEEARREGSNPPDGIPCRFCESTDTKFRYFNNFKVWQPRYLCRTCKRTWTQGGTINRKASDEGHVPLPTWGAKKLRSS